MYTTLDLKILLSDKSIMEKYKGYKLCYVDVIPPTVFDYDEKSKKIIEAPDFSWNEYRWDGPKGHLLQMCEQPNPDFELNEKEFMAYFTPVSLDEQWGDDWDDAPYEHNAGIPYDCIWVDKVQTEIEMFTNWDSLLYSQVQKLFNFPNTSANIRIEITLISRVPVVPQQ